MKRLTLAVVATATLLNSCTKSPDGTSTDGSANKVTFEATITPEASFAESDNISLFAKDGAMEWSNNVKYHYDGSTFVSDNAITRSSDEQQLSYTAIYPYSSGNSSESYTFKAPSDQSSDEALASSDLMVARVEATASNKPTLNFEHKGVKVKVNVSHDVQGLGDTEVTLRALTEISCIFAEDSYQGDGRTSSISPLYDNEIGYEAIIAPQTFDKGTEFLTITTGSTKHNLLSKEDITLNSGDRLTCNVTLNYNQIVLETIVGAWDEDNDIDVDAANMISIDSVHADFYGDIYAPGTSAWELRFIESRVNQTEGTEGNVYVLNIISSDEFKYEDGIPAGNFEFNDNPTSAKDGDIVDSGFYSVTETETANLFILANMTIEKSDDNTYTFKMGASDGEAVFNFNFEADDKDIAKKNRTYISDQTSDATPIINSVELRYFGDLENDGIGDWSFYIGCDGLKLTEDGGLQPGTSGSSISGVFYDDGDFDPVGRYPVSFGGEAMTLSAGKVVDSVVQGTWYSAFRAGAMTTFSPMVAGELVIEEASNGEYTITFECSDDNPYTAHSVATSYTGDVTIIDMNDKGDFGNGAFFHIGNTYLKTNATWRFEMYSKELYDSKFSNGTELIFDLISMSNSSYYMWDIEGEFTISPDEAAAGVVPMAKILTYTDGKVTGEAEITSGHVKVMLGTNSKYTITITDAVCTDGNTYDFKYINYAQGCAYLPTDYVLEGEGGDFSAEYYGSIDSNFDNWFFYIRDAGNLATEPTRCSLSLDILVDKSIGYDGTAPTGRYEFVGSEKKVGFSTFNNMTHFVNYTNELPMPGDILSGYIEIEPNGDNYDVEFEIITTLGRRISGSYTTAIRVADFG